MHGPDGFEEREYERTEHHDDALLDAELLEQLADEERSRENNSSAQIDTLTITVRRIKQERDDMAGALRDIVLGADIMLQPATQLTGAFRGYVEEVKRVARAAVRS